MNEAGADQPIDWREVACLLADMLAKETASDQFTVLTNAIFVWGDWAYHYHYQPWDALRSIRQLPERMRP